MFVIIVVCRLGTLRTDSQRSVAHRSSTSSPPPPPPPPPLSWLSSQGDRGQKPLVPRVQGCCRSWPRKDYDALACIGPLHSTHTHTLFSIHSLTSHSPTVYSTVLQIGKSVCILCCVSEISVRTTRPNWRIPFCPDVPATSITMEVDHWLTIICWLYGMRMTAIRLRTLTALKRIPYVHGAANLNLHA